MKQKDLDNQENMYKKTRLSHKVLDLKGSITIQISSYAKQLKSEGKNVISFSAGEPDFDTPVAIQHAAIKAITNGKTRYTASSGIDELKDAIISKFKKDYNVQQKRKNVIVSCGVKHALYVLFHCHFKPWR